MKTTTDKRWIKYSDIELLVEGKYYQGQHGSWEEPGDSEEFEIYRVFVGEVDITELLSEVQLGEIQNQILD